MAISYPTSLDSFTNPVSSNTLDTPSHSTQHSNENDGVVALETKVGTGASTPTNNKVLRGNGTGTSSWQQLALSTDVTGTLPVANGGTGVATLTGVLIGNGTSAVSVVTAPAGTIVGTSDSQTLTNKILTTPTITKPLMDATNPTAQTYSPTGGATATLDLSLANEHRITMPAGNITIALSNDTNSQKFLVSITQDSGGSRTVTWFTTIKWATGTIPTLTTTGNKRDTFGFIRTGSGTYDGFIVGQNI